MLPNSKAYDYLPFYALGYQCNPFRVLTPDEIAEIAILPPVIEDALVTGELVQLLGCMGCGKSTILRGMAHRLERKGQRVAYEFVKEGEKRWHTDPNGLDYLCLDEAQRISVWNGERGRLLKRAQSGTRLLLATHADFGGMFRRRKLSLVTIQVDKLPGRDDLFGQVIRRRLNNFALPDRPHLDITDEAIDVLRAEFREDIRSAESLLYDLFQARVQPLDLSPVQAPEIIQAFQLTG